jgi:hypothetical protein
LSTVATFLSQVFFCILQFLLLSIFLPYLNTSFVVLLVIVSQIEQVLILPITFLSGVGGGIGGGVNSMTSHMDGCCGMTGGTGGGARFAHCYFTTQPGTPCFDSLSRLAVFQVLLLEIWEYMLGAVSSPEHQCAVIRLLRSSVIDLFMLVSTNFNFSVSSFLEVN